MKNEICIDSGLGFCWAAVPAQPNNHDYKYAKTHLGSMYGIICQNKDYKKEIGKIIDSHFSYKNDFELLMTTEMFRFYVLRLSVVYKYGLIQGREMIKMICRCAFNDSSLTDAESICIMETCHDPRLDNILLEVNYNACW